MFNPAFPLAELRPAPYNPRRIGPEAIEQLGKSLKTLGPVKAVIARDDRTIVAGHQRTKAMLAAGLTHAPVYLLGDISDADEVRFNQIHNSADIELGGCRITRLPIAEGLTARAVALNETGLVIGNDTTGLSVPVIWDLTNAADLEMPNYRGNRNGNVPLTVRVMDGNTPMAGEQVSFEVNGTVVGTATSNRSGYARISYRVPQAAGEKIGVTATVNGMPKIVRAIEVGKNRSSAGVSGTFNEASGKVQLNASVNAVEPNRSVPSGRVNFFMNGRRVATATTDSNGVARAEVALPVNMGSGAANIEARFAGDNLNRAATGRSNVEFPR